MPIVAADEIFEFSSGTNIILLILDTMTSDTFVKLYDRDARRFDRVFSGFVLYTDATGVFPSTRYSLPVMLGAAPYDNRVPIEEYMETALQRDSINSRLLERG